MTAVTLSTIGFRTSGVGEEAAEVVGRGAIVGQREFPVVVETLVNLPAPETARAGAPTGDRVHAGRGGRSSDDLEHQARGLLNLVAMVSRCLQDETATPGERRQWLDEVGHANERLEALYRSGLSREFLTRAPAKTVFTR